MRKTISISLLLLIGLSTSIIAQTETSTNEKINLQSPSSISLFQSNSTDGVWASGTITADRWGIFEDATSTKERVTVLPGGNVGIGTTSPTNKLTIAGNVDNTPSLLIRNSSYNSTNSTGTASLQFGFSNHIGPKIEASKNTNNTTSLNFYTEYGYNTPQLGLTIKPTSNGSLVGIGTANPASRFDVQGGIRTSNSDGRSVVLFTSGDGNSYMSILGGSDNSRFGFQVDGSSKMSIMKNGNVGIGTTSPTNKLTIAGNADNTSSLLIRNSSYNSTNSTGTASLQFGFSNHVGPKIEASKNTNNTTSLNFYTEYGYNTPQLGLTIKPTSNGSLVGIGTTTPDAKLAVNGNIHTKEVKVDLVGWPDYVFEENYNLATLQEVEDHIAEKGHLPNIPSAIEVEQNGIQLGAMNAKLLEKIEELTLYMIEQNKKTEILMKEVETLKQKNAALEQKIK